MNTNNKDIIIRLILVLILVLACTFAYIRPVFIGHKRRYASVHAYTNAYVTTENQDLTLQFHLHEVAKLPDAIKY